MKVLHFINSLGTGGAEKLVLDTVLLYQKKGYDVDVLLLWDNNYPFAEKLKQLNCCKVYILSQSSNYKDMYSLSHIPQIRKIIRNYDLIHVHLFPAQYFAVVANIGIHKKLIFTEHNTSNRRIANKMYKYLEKWCYGRYNKLVCISDEIKDIYNDYLNLGPKSIVIRNGVDLVNIREALSIDKAAVHSSVNPADILLMQVSRFHRPKDQDTVIRALKLLPQHYKLFLAGDGERKEILQQLVVELGLQERVFFLGQRMDVPSLLKAVDIVILSSFYEGLSLASIEGMASGRPFIASDVPGLTEVVKGAGILFPKEDAEKLAYEIKRLATDEDYYETVVANCQKRAQQFDITTMVDEHIALYETVYEEN